MSFLEVIRRQAQDDRKKKALCIMDDHIDLLRTFNEYKNKRNKAVDEIKEIEKKMEELHDEFWKDFEQKLVVKNLITEKDRKRNVDLGIHDGVLFRYIEEEK